MRHFIGFVVIVFSIMFLLYVYRDDSQQANRGVALRVYAPSSFLSEWGPGPEIKKLFEEQTGQKILFMEMADPSMTFQKMNISAEESMGDVVVGLDQYDLVRSADKVTWRELVAPEIKNSQLKDQTIESLNQYKNFVPYDWAVISFVKRKDQNFNIASIRDLLKPELKGKIALQDPRTSSPGLQFVMWVANTFPEDQVSKRYKQELFVTNLKDTNTDFTISFNFSKQDHINANNSVTNVPYQLIIEKSKPNLGATEAKNIKAQSENPKPFFMYQAYIYFAVQGCREDKVTCHNLKTESYKMYLQPELASPNVCPDVNKCYVDVNKIEFDMLDGSIATNDGKPYRVHYTFLVAPQLPFLSKVMQYCARGLAEYGGRQILTEDCLSVNSFSYGQE